jgi:hypothetical protein
MWWRKQEEIYKKAVDTAIAFIEKKTQENLEEIKKEDHSVCPHCNNIGHTRDMVRDWNFSSYLGIAGSSIKHYAHEDCYCKKYNVRRCECGKDFVPETLKKGAIK